MLVFDETPETDRAPSCVSRRGPVDGRVGGAGSWELELELSERERAGLLAFPFRLPLGRSACGSHIGGGPIGDPPWNAMC